MGGPLATALALALAAGTGGAAPDPSALSPAQLAGQSVVYGFPGTTPPPELVRRIRRGQAGAVILFAGNAPSRPALRRLTARLQAIPRPRAVDRPLLVMVDQEGGLVRRIPGPPVLSAAALGRAGPRAGRAAGRATGRLLRGLGVNVDLAPVADVRRPGSDIGRTGRSFGASAGHVARMAVSFADGLARAGVAATAKHFPGFGAAPRNTDHGAVRIDVPATTLRAVDGRPFRALVAHGVPLVMLSTAVYPALDNARPAALSARVVRGELRRRLGFRGVTVTDALDTPALAPVGGTGAVAVRAAAAGNDLLIHAGHAAGVRAADALERAVRAGRLRRPALERSVARVLALRERLAVPAGR